MERDPVAELERDPRGQQHRRHGTIDPRQPGDWFRHLPPGIDRKDDLVVAFGAELLGVKLHVPRRLFPVERAAVHAGAKLDQSIEIGAVAAIDLRQQPLQGVALEDLRAAFVDHANIGQDRQRGVGRNRALVPRQPQAPTPAQPQRLDPRRPAPQRRHRQQHRTTPASQRDPRAPVILDLEQRTRADRHFGAGGGTRAFDHDAQGRVDRRTDGGTRRQCKFDRTRAHCAQSVEQRQRQHRDRPGKPDEPAIGQRHGHQQGNRRPRRRRQHRRAGGVDHARNRFPGEGRGPVARQALSNAAPSKKRQRNWAPAFAGEARKLEGGTEKPLTAALRSFR